MVNDKVYFLPTTPAQQLHSSLKMELMRRSRAEGALMAIGSILLLTVVAMAAGVDADLMEWKEYLKKLLSRVECIFCV